MIYQTAAEYRAELFVKLRPSGFDQDHVARYWDLFKDDPERSRPLYDALNDWRFTYPSELAAQGFGRSEVERAHERALECLKERVAIMIELFSHLDEWEAEQRQAELQRMDRQMESILAEGATPSD